MNARLLSLWDRLRASWWLLPAVFTALAIAASQGLLGLDRVLVRSGADVAWLHGAGEPEGARAVLSTIAGSMITVAGVTFSTILVALSLTSSQYGPRLLRGFLRDRGNQAVLGTFIATFVYCLLVLRNVPMEVGSEQVPQLAILGAMGLALAGVVMLIWFIHHAASSIQASSVIERAGAELDAALAATFPSRDEEGGLWADVQPEDVLPEGFSDRADEVVAKSSGYVQEVDVSGLVALAQEQGCVMWVLHDRGSFVAEGQPIARVSVRLGEAERGRIDEALVLDHSRASSRDVVRAVASLSEIAVRALSPGINDPYTAGNALRRLGQSLTLLGDRRLPTPSHHDDEGELRVVLPTPTVKELLHAAFDRARHYGRADPYLPVELLEVLATVGLKGRHPGLRRALLAHAEAVQEVSLEALTIPSDRQRVKEAYDSARAALKPGG